MTDHDLATLLRADVSATEPPGALDPAVPLRMGRRRIRRRMALGGIALVAVVGAATVVPFALLDPPPGEDRPADPAPYDAEEMPRIMDEHVRTVLDRHVGSLGPVTFSAQPEAISEELPPGRYDEAATMRVTYGSVIHRYQVSVLHAGSEAEGPVRRICHRETAARMAFVCRVTREDGMFVVQTLRAFQPTGVNPLNDRGYTVVRTDAVDEVPPGRLFFERSVKVIKSDTLLTYVTERVRAPTLLKANQTFKVPVDDLVEIGIDPALAIPVPDTP